MGSHRHRPLVATTAAIATAVAVAAATSTPTRASPPPSRAAFVKRRGAHLELDGRRFRVAGVNCYFLHYRSEAAVDEVLDDAQRMGLDVIRCWGFLDGPSDHGALHPKPGVVDEEGLGRIDRLLVAAEARGLRLIVTLVNNWDDFGGMKQYGRWFGIEHDAFFFDRRARDEYRLFVRALIERENPLKDGLRYRDDPTILAWELANEPRCKTDPSGETITRWTAESARFIRSLDPNHLIAVGDEGFLRRDGASDWTEDGSQGVDWEALIAIDEIDVATFHLYPDHWGKTKDPRWAERWIEEHIELARKAGKPALLEEYGIKGERRDATYARWCEIVRKNDGDGWLAWMLADDAYPDHDGFTFHHPGKTAEVLAREARRLHGARRVY